MSIEVEETERSSEVRPRCFSVDDAITEGNIKNDNVISHWIGPWTRNSYANFPLVKQDTQNLRNFFKYNDGETCIIVSSGPSLDGQIKDILAADRSKFKIVSTTSALNPLIANGIMPDYATINDGAPWVADLHYTFLYEQLKEIPLIISTTCHPSTARKWPGPLLWYNDYSPEVPLMSNDGGLFLTYYSLTGIPVGGCTTNLSIRIAVLLGFKNIIMAGMDLSFQGRTAHCTKYKRDDFGKWVPRESNSSFYTEKARWIFRGCPDGCSFVLNEWQTDMPIHPQWDEWEKCPDCGKKFRHVVTSAEYLFYMRDLSSLVNGIQGGSITVDFGNGPENRTLKISTLSDNSITCVLRLPEKTLKEALE